MPCWKSPCAFGRWRIGRYAAEVAEHKRDPYSLVEEIVNSLEKMRNL